MSLNLVKNGKYRVKGLNCTQRMRKGLENRGFGKGNVVEKKRKFNKTYFMTHIGEFRLPRRILDSIIVEKV